MQSFRPDIIFKQQRVGNRPVYGWRKRSGMYTKGVKLPWMEV
jgi:hypothetical protein